MERLKLWMIGLAVPIVILAIAIEVGSFPKELAWGAITVGSIACAFAVKELFVLIKSSDEEAKKRFGTKVIPYADEVDKK